MNKAERLAVESELKATTVGYVNKKWTTPPTGTHWANGLTMLARATRSFFVCIEGKRARGETLTAKTTML